MENQELFEQLVQAYSNKAYACYSDDARAQKIDDDRWANALSRQSVFTEEEIASEFTARHNAWIASQRA